MSYQLFEETYDPPHDSKLLTEAEIASYVNILPESVLEIWKEFGWSGYGDGLLWFTNPKDFDPALSAWDRLLDDYGVSQTRYVLTRSAFGHLFLWDKRYFWSFDPIGHLSGGGWVI